MRLGEWFKIAPPLVVGQSNMNKHSDTLKKEHALGSVVGL